MSTLARFLRELFDEGIIEFKIGAVGQSRDASGKRTGAEHPREHVLRLAAGGSTHRPPFSARCVNPQ